VIVTGTSDPHLRAIVQTIREQLEEKHGLEPRSTDGSLETSWVVLDYFDVIVHVMRANVREHYDLEGLWSDAPRLRPRRKSVAKPRATAAP
jgi:ribosome-associated protein